MVKARQMKDSVQCQNLDFLSRGMSEPGRILQSNVRGDGDFARQLGSLARFGSGESERKRQHVRCLVLAAKLAIQRTHGRTAGDQHIHLAGHANGLPRTQHEAIERVFV